MEYVGPYTYNGVRFALGSVSLFPLLWFGRRKDQEGQKTTDSSRHAITFGSLLAGVVLFVGSSFQQSGMVYTTAGKGGFITGLYVVLVPILGLFVGRTTHVGTWGGALLAVAGLYFLSITEQVTIAKGDLLVLISALFWAVHVLIIDWLSPKASAIKLAAIQFGIASVMSLLLALFVEHIRLHGIIAAAIPILYGGLFSTGIAFTLQIVGQKRAHPAHAAILLSLEGAFAALGGWLLLGEFLSSRSALGCALMLTGMIISQLNIPTAIHTRIDRRTGQSSA